MGSSDISVRSAAIGSLRSLSHLNSLRRNQMTKSRSYANLSGKLIAAQHPSWILRALWSTLEHSGAWFAMANWDTTLYSFFRLHSIMDFLLSM